MSTVLINANRYRSLLQSALVLVQECTDALVEAHSGTDEGGCWLAIPAAELEHLHARATAIAKAIESLTGPCGEQPNRTSDRSPAATRPVGNLSSPPSPLAGEGRGEGASPSSPSFKLSLHPVGPGDGPDKSTPSPGAGNGNGGSSRAPLRSS